jgi:uncharacterized protein (TIGR03435 family)
VSAAPRGPLPTEVPSRNAADATILADRRDERAETYATASGVPGYIRPVRGMLEGKGVNMRMLADFLGGSLGQSVVTDNTGVIGGFDSRLEWTPTEGELDYKHEDRPIDPNGSSIFTAVQEQLGLKLEASKGPIEVLVIDHVERPSQNRRGVKPVEATQKHNRATAFEEIAPSWYRGSRELISRIVGPRPQAPFVGRTSGMRCCA